MTLSRKLPSKTAIIVKPPCKIQCNTHHHHINNKMFKSVLLLLVATTLLALSSAQSESRQGPRALQTAAPVAIVPVAVPVVVPVAAPVAVPTPPPTSATKSPKSTKKAKSPSTGVKMSKKTVQATFRGERLDAGSARKLRMYQNNLA